MKPFSITVVVYHTCHNCPISIEVSLFNLVSITGRDRCKLCVGFLVVEGAIHSRSGNLAFHLARRLSDLALDSRLPY